MKLFFVCLVLLCFRTLFVCLFSDGWLVEENSIYVDLETSDGDELSTDGCLARSSVYSRGVVTVILIEDKAVCEPPPSHVFGSVHTPLLKLLASVSLIQLQASLYIDGGYKARTPLGRASSGTSGVPALAAMTARPSPSTEMTCSCHKISSYWFSSYCSLQI